MTPAEELINKLQKNDSFKTREDQFYDALNKLSFEDIMILGNAMTRFTNIMNKKSD